MVKSDTGFEISGQSVRNGLKKPNTTSTYFSERCVHCDSRTLLSLKDYIERKGIELIIDPEIEEKNILCDILNYIEVFC